LPNTPGSIAQNKPGIEHMYPGIPSIRAGIKHGNEQKIDRRHPGNAQNIPGEASNSAHPNSVAP